MTATMKKLAVSLVLVVAGLGVGCFETSPKRQGEFSHPLCQVHFAGALQLAKDTNSAKISRILALPATGDLRKFALGKLAKAPQAFWRGVLPPDGGDQSALFQPLLDDLWEAETYLEVRGPTNRAETVLAIELNNGRAGLWSTNLWKLMEAWRLGTPGEMTSSGFKGWEAKRQTVAPSLVQFVRAEKWVLIGFGPGPLKMLPALAQQVAKGGRPITPLNGSFLEAEVDFPRLEGWFPSFASYRLPFSRMVMAGKGENIRTEVRMQYSDPIPWTFEPWKIPTHMITEPLISFTVGQGIAPILGQFDSVKRLGLKTLPSQFCLWGQGYDNCQSFLTLPMANPSNVIQTIAPVVPQIVKGQMKDSMGEFGWKSNKAELVWFGLPFIVPHLRPAWDGKEGFLFAELFPMSPRTNSPPPELFGQVIGQKDLVYYDWEITQARLPHARQMYQLYNIVNRRQMIPSTAPTEKWLAAIAPLLGNTVTEVRKSSAKELTLVRKSHLGMTGFELVTLARWIDSPGFPLAFQAPPPTLRPPARAVPKSPAAKPPQP